MLFTGSTYTNVNDWSFTLIAGNNCSGYGDTDGILGVNTLCKLSSQSPNMYRGGTLNGEPIFYFFNVWGSAWGSPYGSNRFYIRKLFWNGSAWEVTTELTSTDDMRSFATNSSSDKFYFSNQTLDKIQYYDLNTSGSTSIIDSLNSLTEQERVPKTIDLINGVGFDGKSWTFDGIDDYVDGTPLLPLIQNNTQGTIEVWVKTNDSTPTDFIKPIMSFSDTSASQTILIGLLNNGKLRGYTKNTAQNIIWSLTTTNKVFNDNEWINLVLSQDDGEPKLYVDGEYISQGFDSFIDKSFWINNIPEIDNVRIGCQNSSGTGNIRLWDGDISNVKYYNIPLTAEEVKQNYKALKYRYK